MYMVSDEFQSLVRDDLIKEKDRKTLKINKPEDSRFSCKFLYKGKLIDEIPPDFFIVNIAHGQDKEKIHRVMNGKLFSPSNREKITRGKDAKDYFMKNKGLKSFKKYANFQLLLYLSKIIDIHTVITICECVRD